MGEVKERNCNKNPSSAIFEANTEITLFFVSGTKQKSKRQEQLAQRQLEIQREAEEKKKAESERRFQERRAANREAEPTRTEANEVNSRSSTPATTR